MKKIYLTLFNLCFAIIAMSQTPGFSYQAVILNPNVQNLPGNNVEQGLLSESDIAIRFLLRMEKEQNIKRNILRKQILMG